VGNLGTPTSMTSVVGKPWYESHDATGFLKISIETRK
jgi:hypothetical protein